MAEPRMKVALIHEVFPGAAGEAPLTETLARAAARDAELAVLPELGVDRWIPSRREVSPDDCEPPGGERQRRMSRAAAAAGIALLGGAIVDDPASGERRNRALLFGADGRELARYDKLHLPSEPGFWESDHYRPGNEIPRPVEALSLPVGLQICSDLNRPAACELLGLAGAAAILAPRATPAASYPRWLAVIRADAIFSASYVVSVNRPRSEDGADIGGPSVVAAPDGTVVVETVDPLTVVELDGDTVARSRRDYPGYLAVRAELYARGWADASS